MHYRRIREPGATYFFTVVTHRRLPLFAPPEAVALLHRCIVEVKRYHPFAIDAFVILPDHLHMLWTQPEGDAGYSIRWQLIKTAFTRHYLRVNPTLDRSTSRQTKGEQAVWQRRFWEHLIRDDEDFSAHLDYIHLNPVRHAVAKLPRDWPHSSFLLWVAKGHYSDNWSLETQPELVRWAEAWDR